MSLIDGMTDENIESLKTKCALAIGLAEKYSAMLEVALEHSVDLSYKVLKERAEDRLKSGSIKHSFTVEAPPSFESLDG